MKKVRKRDKDTVTASFTYDRQEGEKAILVGESDEIVIPSNLLPSESTEGDIISITLSTDEAEKRKRELKAKEILNVILNV